MIRILHTADWHLGQTFFGYDRTEEHEVFLNWLAEEIRQKEIDALIIAGDVFDVSNPSAASQSMYYQFIYRVTAENPYLQIVIVAGNHDSAARLEAPLPLLQAMRTEVRGVVRKLEGGEIDYDHLTVELKNRKGEVEETFSYPVQTGIVSEETSATMRYILEMVVAEGSGRNGQVQGFRVGGKTATSQTLPRGSGRYISSFIGFAPADDPQVIAIAIINNPQGVYYGGQVAAPIIRQLYENILPYLGLEKTEDTVVENQ